MISELEYHDGFIVQKHFDSILNSTIAEIKDRGTLRKEEQDQYGALFAASPNLLRACKMMLEALEANNDGDSHYSVAARKAIEKAEQKAA